MSLQSLPKDAYLKIAQATNDDRAILNMLRTNRDRYGDNYFEGIMNLRYPHLIKFKK